MIPIHTGRSARVTTFAILLTLIAFMCQPSAYAQIGGAANIGGAVTTQALRSRASPSR